MPITKISEYSATAANNTDINGIDIAEGCAPSGINDAIRTLMKQIKDLQAGTSGDTIPVTAGGTGSTTASAARAALGAGVGDVTTTGTQTLTNKTLSGADNTLTVDGTDAVGFRNVPVNSQSTAYTLVLADAGKVIFHPSSDANARTFTIAANASVAYPIGTVIAFCNMTSQVVTIAITSDTMYLGGQGTTGSRSLAQYGIANALKITSTSWIITGTGLT